MGDQPQNPLGKLIEFLQVFEEENVPFSLDCVLDAIRVTIPRYHSEVLFFADGRVEERHLGRPALDVRDWDVDGLRNAIVAHRDSESGPSPS